MPTPRLYRCLFAKVRSAYGRTISVHVARLDQLPPRAEVTIEKGSTPPSAERVERLTIVFDRLDLFDQAIEGLRAARAELAANKAA